MGYTLEAACGCNIGKKRANNEDNFFFNGICLEEENKGTHGMLYMEQPIRQGVWVSVFDGMGGENYGEQAAFTAARRMQEYVRTPREFYISEGKYLKRMAASLNLAVVQKKDELVTSRMGTTMAALYFTYRSVCCVNVGDSRVYRLRNRVLSQLSEDHVSKRPIPEGRKAPLTQHLGMDPQEVQLSPFIAKEELQPGDRYLICSDGLTDMVSNVEIMDILLSQPDVQPAANALIDAALEQGGRDNITVIVCNIH